MKVNSFSTFTLGISWYPSYSYYLLNLSTSVHRLCTSRLVFFVPFYMFISNFISLITCI